MAKLNSRMFPEIYKSLGVNVSELGCIMADVEPITGITDLVEGGADDLFFSDNHDLKYAQGAVGEKTAHVTLLYGLMEPGPVWSEHVTRLLADNKLTTVRVSDIDIFPSNYPGEDYSVVVAKLDLSPELLDAHQRLSLLPHINTFPEYQPHITLAYVKSSAARRWVYALKSDSGLIGKELRIVGLNYGGN